VAVLWLREKKCLRAVLWAVRIFAKNFRRQSMDANEQEEILRKATEHMVQSLNSFGMSETLKLLVKFSNQDAILRELLTIFPSLVNLNLFLQGKPVYKIQMNEQALKQLLNTKVPFLIREETERKEVRTIRKKTSRTPKKTSSRKRKIRR
jgi:hypothetical protein